MVDLLGQFKNNILSNQIAGESTRIGIMLNVNQVIEVFTDSIDGFLKIQVVPLGAYIKEEYLHYGQPFTFENLYVDIIDEDVESTILVSDLNFCVARLTTGQYIVSDGVGVYMDADGITGGKYIWN